MSSITWTNERRKLSQLIPWPKNPRQIKGDQVRRLQESLTEFGQVEPVCIGPDNELYNGHQRLKSWQAKFGDIEIDVRVSSRVLTEKEREKLTVFLHKGAAGEWDYDALANGFEIPDLIEWGFEPFELGISAEIPFDQYDGDGDGGHSRIQNGTKVRVVIGALMFDIDDPDHSIYAITKSADQDAAKESVLAFILEGGLA